MQTLKKIMSILVDDDDFKIDSKKEKLINNDENIIEEKISNDEIKILDKNGESHTINRSDWVENEFNPVVQSNWDNYERLYVEVIRNANLGLNKELKPVALRLYNNDTDKERGTDAYLIYLISTKKYEEAEEEAKEFLKTNKSELILIRLYEIYSKKGEEEKGYNILNNYIEDNPNSLECIRKLVQIISEKEGKIKALEKLKYLAEEKKSWIARLFLTEYFLESDNIEQARENTNMLLEQTKNESESLLSTIELYKKHKQYDEINYNLVNKYDSQKHNYQIPLSLLQSLLINREANKGLELTSIIPNTNNTKIINDLVYYENNFYNLILNYKAKNNSNLHLATKVYDKPIWYENLNSPNWLHNNKNDDSKKVLILPFRDLRAESKLRFMKNYDEIGKYVYSIPSAINFSMDVYLNFKSNLAVNYNEYVGLIIENQDYKDNYINEILLRNKHLDYLITGKIIDYDGNVNKVVVEIIDNKENLEVLYEGILDTKNMSQLYNSIVEKIKNKFNYSNIEIPSFNNDDARFFDILNLELEVDINPSSLVQNLVWKIKQELKYLAAQIIKNSNDIKCKVLYVSLLFKLYRLNKNIPLYLKDESIALIKNRYFSDQFTVKFLPILLSIYGEYEELDNVLTKLKGSLSNEYGVWIDNIIKEIG